MAKKKPTLAIFWGDTRELLSYEERRQVLSVAVLESITPNEILLRDRRSERLIVVTSTDEKDLFCAVCSNDVVQERYGKTCPRFATCLVKGKHTRRNGVSKKE